MVDQAFSEGSDCTKQFREAYENRYTWDSNFPGYEGNCSWSNGKTSLKGNFLLDKNLKATVKGFVDPSISKAVESQLWEVSIHRVNRPFEQVHGSNTFKFGDLKDAGIEVIVGGKNKGDRYRIKDNVITMVSRNIHGKLIKVLTKEVFHTDRGYLSKIYTSQFFESGTREKIQGENIFNDKFEPLDKLGTWALSERSIKSKDIKGEFSKIEIFSFYEMKLLN